MMPCNLQTNMCKGKKKAKNGIRLIMAAEKTVGLNTDTFMVRTNCPVDSGSCSWVVAAVWSLSSAICSLAQLAL